MESFIFDGQEIDFLTDTFFYTRGVTQPVSISLFHASNMCNCFLF